VNPRIRVGGEVERIRSIVWL